MKPSSQKFADLKARREAALLKRKFYWLTECDAKAFAETYLKTESYKIKEGLKNERNR